MNWVGQRLVNALASAGAYRRYTGVAYGGEPRQKLDVYIPKNPPPRAPVVIFFYGGRWSGGSRQGFKFAAQALTSLGFIAAVPDYRLYPRVTFPAFVQDGALAVKWAHDHAARYGGDPGKLFVMGHSAGAHIAAMLALDGQYLRAAGGDRQWLAGMIGLAGPYDFLPLKEDDLKAIFGPPPRYPDSQPVNFVDGGQPPLLLLHGLKDRTVLSENARSLAARVRETGGEANTLYYRRKTHIGLVAALAPLLRHTATVLTDIGEFIDGHAAESAAEKARSPLANEPPLPPHSPEESET
jgi:acetyl esterase/lipase